VTIGRLPARTLLRRFTLGSGPLKRSSDRVEFLSRIVLVLALLVAAPVGVAVGTTASASMRTTAEEQAATRSQARATLLTDAPQPETQVAARRPTRATWTAPDGTARTGVVDAPAGAPAGSQVVIWVDRSGEPTDPPLSRSAIADQGVVLGVLALLGVVLLALGGHLLVLWWLGRRRDRRWAEGWASVEPLWATRFR
jgi:hypothetical protein